VLYSAEQLYSASEFQQYYEGSGLLPLVPTSTGQGASEAHWSWQSRDVWSIVVVQRMFAAACAPCRPETSVPRTSETVM